MKKSLLVALALAVPPTPGQAAQFAQSKALTSLSSLAGSVDVPAAPAVKAVEVKAASSDPSSSDAQPDWNFTPGRLCTEQDSDYAEHRYPSQVAYCKRHVTREMKVEVAQHYGIPESEWKNYEFDHLIPLAVGGNSHVENLWPQPSSQNDGPNSKDKLEYNLYLQLSAGKITQAEAVRQIYAWFGRNAPFQSFQPAVAAR